MSCNRLDTLQAARCGTGSVMVSRKAFFDELQELRTLVLQEDLEQVQLHVRLFVHTCDHLTEPIHPSAMGAWRDSPSYAADDVGLSVTLVRSLRGCVAEAGFAIESDPRHALKALDEALRALEETAGEGEWEGTM
jgi:hypothetical protein